MLTLVMFYEVSKTRQFPGELRRRWFTSREQDLYVWTNDSNEIVAFQLCYGKHKDEHAIYWKKSRGFAHLKVDDGEGGGLAGNTPILLADGYFDRDAVLKRFLYLSSEVSEDVATFVRARLSEYQNRHAEKNT